MEQDLERLVERCAEERDRFARGQDHDDQACLELFRRAIVEQDPAAWHALHTQYASLVSGWVRQHRLADRIDDHDDLIMRVFERFWQAVPPEKFASFVRLASLLSYLKLCVFGAIIDQVRAQQVWERHRAASELADQIESDPLDEVVLDDLAGASLWRLIESALPEPADRLVIHLTCVFGLKPREIALRHPETFPTVKTVYQRKRVVLERLRRDARLRSLWEGRTRSSSV